MISKLTVRQASKEGGLTDDRMYELYFTKRLNILFTCIIL